MEWGVSGRERVKFKIYVEDWGGLVCGKGSRDECLGKRSFEESSKCEEG